MITNKQELKEYLNADKFALNRNKRRPSHFDLTWRFEIALRKSEYFRNTREKGFKLLKVWGGGVLEML